MKKMLAVVAAASLVAVAAPAFAANPFSDVPMNHWAYDAVEQMAAKGILEGYPNGTFKGNRAMTRYEIAQMVARMMANGVGGADADKLKALIVEFAPELEALGVKVDGFDGRLSKLEKGVGGWSIWGQMRFDYNSHKRGEGKEAAYGFNAAETHGIKALGKSGHGFTFNRARLFLKRELSNNVAFEARWHGGQFDRYWVTAKDFLGAQGLQFRAGNFYVDWEGPDNLYQSNHYWDDDANFLDGTLRGAELSYKRGGFELTGIVGSDWGNKVYDATSGNELYGARLRFGSEKFFLSANFVMFNGVGADEKEGEKDFAKTGYYGNWYNLKRTAADAHLKAYWFALGFTPVKGLSLTGAYWKESIDDLGYGKAFNKNVFDYMGDDPKAWKIVLDVNQDLLKFTSLRAEYGKYDGGFYVQNGSGWMAGPDTYNKNGAMMAADTKFIKVSAIQNWGKKFATYERWAQYDQDDVSAAAMGGFPNYPGAKIGGKAKELQFGIHYKYSPNLQFMVDYTKYDGQLLGGAVNSEAEDKVVRFRTFLSF